MTLTNRFKHKINDALRHAGYRIERIVDYSKHQLNVFEVVVKSARTGRC